MGTGTVSSRYFVLGLLTQQPMSGYDIKRFLKSLSWLIGSPSFGSLYPTLHALHGDGFVTVEVVPREGKPPRKIYSITEAGEQALEEWINQPPVPGASLKAFVMRLILAGSFPHGALVAHLRQRRSQTAVHHAALEQAAASLDEGVDLGQRLALEYGLAIATEELAWLDSTLNRLAQKPLPVEVVPGDSTAPRA